MLKSSEAFQEVAFCKTCLWEFLLLLANVRWVGRGFTGVVLGYLAVNGIRIETKKMVIDQ